MRDCIMSNRTTDISRDWLSSKRASLLAWWIPRSAMLVSLFARVSLRSAVWVIALGWMGASCIMLS